MYKVDNAIILAAGTSSRFAPLSFEIHKSLIMVRGEVLIERQIKQLREKGIKQIVIVTGYKAEQFDYLIDKYGVILVHNNEYLVRNNHSSIFAAKQYLSNSYICSSDNYFVNNPFELYHEQSFYSSVYISGKTNEWCIKEDNGRIVDVSIGGENSWIMLGHVFWDEEFSKRFISILEKEYEDKKTLSKLWETIYIEHIDELNMKIKKYSNESVFEFDTLDELRNFDQTYVYDTRSKIIKEISIILNVKESEIKNFKSLKGDDNSAIGFTFFAGKNYRYYYVNKKIEEVL